VAEDVWIPLVDEPIGSIVAQLQSENPEIDALISSPDVPAYDGTETWVEALLREERHRAAVVAELRAVAEEIAADPRYADGEPIGPDDDTRARFREFAKKQLG
jgi:hypothetical protein